MPSNRLLLYFSHFNVILAEVKAPVSYLNGYMYSKTQMKVVSINFLCYYVIAFQRNGILT